MPLLTDFELAVFIRGMYVNRAAEVITYAKNWGDQFSLECVREIPEKLDGMFGIRPIELSELSYTQQQQLGFSRWDEPNDNNEVLMLIPLWIARHVRQTTPVISIGGDNVTLAEADNDTRFGCLAYGTIVIAEAT